MSSYPCLGCTAPKKFLGCHAVCEEYLSIKSEQQQKAEDRRKAKLYSQRSAAYDYYLKHGKLPKSKISVK